MFLNLLYQVFWWIRFRARVFTFRNTLSLRQKATSAWPVLPGPAEGAYMHRFTKPLRLNLGGKTKPEKDTMRGKTELKRNNTGVDRWKAGGRETPKFTILHTIILRSMTITHGVHSQTYKPGKMWEPSHKCQFSQYSLQITPTPENVVLRIDVIDVFYVFY